MKQFDSMTAFASFLDARMHTLRSAQEKGLDQAAAIIQTEAKEEIGTYQDAAGPFPEWSPLAYATLYGGVSPEGHRYPGKVELGYAPPDNPLLRDGTLRDHITRSSSPTHAEVGVKSEIVTPAYGDPVDIGDVAMWQELGTERMPPRSFLGHAAAHKAAEAVSTVADVVYEHLSDKAMGGYFIFRARDG